MHFAQKIGIENAPDLKIKVDLKNCTQSFHALDWIHSFPPLFVGLLLGDVPYNVLLYTFSVNVWTVHKGQWTCISNIEKFLAYFKKCDKSVTTFCQNSIFLEQDFTISILRVYGTTWNCLVFRLFACKLQPNLLATMFEHPLKKLCLFVSG